MPPGKENSSTVTISVSGLLWPTFTCPFFGTVTLKRRGLKNHAEYLLTGVVIRYLSQAENKTESLVE